MTFHLGMSLFNKIFKRSKAKELLKACSCRVLSSRPIVPAYIFMILGSSRTHLQEGLALRPCRVFGDTLEIFNRC